MNKVSFKKLPSRAIAVFCNGELVDSFLVFSAGYSYPPDHHVPEKRNKPIYECLCCSKDGQRAISEGYDPKKMTRNMRDFYRREYQ